MADLVVVGAGVVGASVAYHSARAGASVVLLDASALPGEGVTGRSFGWIGGPAGGDPVDGSTPLRRSVLEDHRRLEREVPGVRVRWSGSLVWGRSPHPDDGGPVASGPDEQILGAAEVSRLEPNLRVPPARAVFRRSDGAVDAVEMTEALVRAAVASGATARLGAAVTRLRMRDDVVVGVETERGSVDAGSVVLAAGVGVRALCASVGVDVPVTASPALLVRAAAPPGLVRTVVAGPDLEVREVRDGELLLAGEYGGETSRDDLRRSAEGTLARLRATFRGAEQVRLVGVEVGMRPMPVDGLPLVGPVPGRPGLYLAVMHAGVTLAPVVGRLVAAELAEGRHAPELDGVRPDRVPAGGSTPAERT